MSIQPEDFQEPPRPDFSHIYPWIETPEEAALRKALSESVMRFGSQCRTEGTVALSGDDLAQANKLGMRPDDLIGVGRLVSNNGRRIHAEALPTIGLDVELGEQLTYETHPKTGTPPVQPIELQLGWAVRTTEPDIWTRIVVPSRHFTDYSTGLTMERAPQETQPPHVRIWASPRARVGALASLAELNCNLSDTGEDGCIDGRYKQNLLDVAIATGQLLTALGADALPQDAWGARHTVRPLTPDMMEETRRWAGVFFEGSADYQW